VLKAKAFLGDGSRGRYEGKSEEGFFVRDYGLRGCDFSSFVFCGLQRRFEL
jgi:hypothetical protein